MDKLKVDLAPLDVAANTYYWKPFAALFRALEMRMYSHSEIKCEGPVLDLCCGDGRVALMLRELDILNKPLCGLDYSRVELKKAQRIYCHRQLLQSDANHLPFKSGSFSTIICNGALESIPSGPDSALKEIARVLKENGVVVATIPTNRFIDMLIIPKLMEKFSSTWASIYTDGLNKRLTHLYVYSPLAWECIFKKTGLSIVETRSFFSPRAGALWNILTINIFRLFGFLRFIKNKKVTSVFSNLLKRAFKKIYIEELDVKSESGYLFIIAKKAVPSLEESVPFPHCME